MALPFLPPGLTTGPTLRAIRLGYRWCDGFGQFVRISDAGENRLRVDLAPNKYVLMEKVKRGQYHYCWWEGPAEGLRDLVEGLRPAVERNRCAQAVTFFVDDHCRELGSAVKSPTRKQRVLPKTKAPAVEVIIPKKVIGYPQSSKGISPPWQVNLLWPEAKVPPVATDFLLDIHARTREEASFWLCARSLAVLLQEARFLSRLSDQQKRQFLLNLVTLVARLGWSRDDLPKFLAANGLGKNVLEAFENYRARLGFYNADPMNHLWGAPEPPQRPVYDDLIDDLRYGSGPLGESAACRANLKLVNSLVGEVVSGGHESCRELLFLCCEFLLHGPLGVVTHLMVLEQLADHLGLSWEEAWAFHAERSSGFHRQQVELIDRNLGAVSYQDYIKVAMYHGANSLYEGEETTRLIGPGEAKHFDTPAETPLFGVMSLFYVSRIWNALQRPGFFPFVEMGPGTGALAETMVHALEVLADRVSSGLQHDWPGLRRAFRYQGIELSHTLAVAQRERWGRLESAIPMEVLEVSAFDPDLASRLPSMEFAVIFSHELLDMFPPVKIVKRDGKICEVRLTHRNGVIQEILSPLPPHLYRFLENHPLAEGQTDFLQPDLEPWSRNVASIARKGVMMTWDYGYVDRDKERSAIFYPIFEGISAHLRGEYVGEVQGKLLRRLWTHPNAETCGVEFYGRGATGVHFPKDMSVQVDFKEVERVLSRQGFHTVLSMTMRDFVLKWMLKPDSFWGEAFMPAAWQALREAGILQDEDPYWGSGYFPQGPFLRTYHRLLVSRSSGVNLERPDWMFLE